MIERSLWHPVASASALAEAPLAAQLLEHPLVLWRDGSGAARAFTDRCPHRGARLSLGCARGGQLACAYHGWRFDGRGQVVTVPALPGFTPPASHRVAEHALVERYGLLWVRLDAPAASSLVGNAGPHGDGEPPAFEAEHDARLRKLNCGPYEVATSAPRIVENFLDMAHFAFVHSGWLGDAAHPEIADYRITETPTGFVATGCRAWQPRANVHAASGAEVVYTYEVNAPYSAVLCKVPDTLMAATATKAPEAPDAGAQGSGRFRESIALFICPVTPESSRVWFRLAVNDLETPDDELQAFQRTIFGQDQPVLESQQPKRLPVTAAAQAQELHCAADRASSAYRRCLLARGIGFGTL